MSNNNLYFLAISQHNSSNALIGFDSEHKNIMNDYLQQYCNALINIRNNIGKNNDLNQQIMTETEEKIKILITDTIEIHLFGDNIEAQAIMNSDKFIQFDLPCSAMFYNII